MTDDPLRDLMSSPLEREDRTTTPRPRGDRPDRGPGPWLVLGIVAGMVAVVVGFLVGGDGPDEAPVSTPATSAATTTTPVATAPILPPGFTSVEDGRLGMRVERVLVRPDAVFVSLSTVVPSGIDGSATAGFDGGLWELALQDGSTTESGTESRSTASPGFVTVRFDAEGLTPDDISSVRLVGVGTRFSDELTGDGSTTLTLPEDGSAVSVELVPDSFELDAGVTLALDEVSFEEGIGMLAWELSGSDDTATAIVFPDLTLTEVGTGTTPVVLTQGAFGGFVGGLPGQVFFEEATLDRSGGVEFRPADPTLPFPTGVEYEIGLEASVTWQIFTPTTAVIPIEGALVTDLTG